jgi:PAS domain S-box-containing protein
MSERTDIRAEENVRVVESVHDDGGRFRALAENLPALLWSSTAEGVSDYLNPQWAAYTGIPVEELLGAGRWEIIHPDDRAATIEAWVRSTTEQIPFEAEMRLRRHDGAWRWFQARGVPRRDATGRIVQWFGTTTDIEERKQAERRQRMLTDAAAILLAAEDPEVMMKGLFERVSRNIDVDTYFNYMVDETGEALRLASWAGVRDETARTMERLAFGQSICGTVALHRQAIVATGIQDSDDPRLQRVKGLGLRAYVCRPLLDDGRLLGTLSFGSRTRDRFPDDELEFLRTITRYVEVACERLRLVQQLREADRRKDEFLATLAHELRNPLAPLRHSLEIMRLSPRDAANVENARSIMERQLGQMVRLIDDLLDVSRIRNNKIPLRPEPIDLRNVIEHAVEINRPFLEENGLALTVTLPPGPLSMVADPSRLTQVFDNLLNNAVKYTDRGGRITITGERDAGVIRVTVRDTGIGIPAAMLGRVFDMFSQVDRSVERSQGGLGLGLNIVARLVAKHGGSVVAHSDGPGQGSAFTVQLPLAEPVDEPAAAGPDAAAAPSPAATPRRRVLVVDDNRDAAITLTMMLGLMGCETRTAYSGFEALDAGAEFRPELILLDIGMPGLNGFDTARRIREEEWGRDIFLVALTGWGQGADRRASQEAGFDEHVVKPIEPAALEQLLARRVSR